MLEYIREVLPDAAEDKHEVADGIAQTVVEAEGEDILIRIIDVTLDGRSVRTGGELQFLQSHREDEMIVPARSKRKFQK